MGRRSASVLTVLIPEDLTAEEEPSAVRDDKTSGPDALICTGLRMNCFQFASHAPGNEERHEEPEGQAESLILTGMD